MMGEINKTKKQLVAELAESQAEINELKKKIKSLVSKTKEKESDARYKELTDNLPQAVFEADAKGKITYANHEAFRMTGYSPEDLKNGFDVARLFVPEDWKRAMTNLKKVLIGEPFDDHDYTAIRKDGTTYPVQIFSSAVTRSGKVTGVRGIAFDLTERKENERALAESENKYRLLSELMFDAAYAYRVEPDGKLFKLWVMGAIEKMTGYTREDVEDMKGWGNFLHPDDLEISDRQIKALMAGKSDTVEYRIITKNGKVRWERDYARPIWDKQKKRTTYIYGAIQDITEQKEYQERLESLSSIVEQSENSIAITDLEGTITYANPKFFKSLNLKKEDVMGKSWKTFSPKQSGVLEKAKEINDTVMVERKTWEGEYWEKVGNKIFWRSGKIIPIKDHHGNIIFFVYISEDITRRKQYEISLKEQEQTLSALINAPTETAILTDPAGKILNINKIGAQTLNRKPEELVGTNIYGYFPPKLRESRKAQSKTVVKTGEPVRFQDQRADRIYDNNIYPVFDTSKKIHALAIYARDITEQQKALDALAESEERFRMITENAMEWIWELDENGKYIYVSPVVEKILGYPPSDFQKKNFYHFFHPEDKKKYRKYDFKTMAQTEPLHGFEHRQVHRNGETVWFTTSGIPIMDPKGNMIGYRGINANITERKRAEQALQESEERYRKMFELSPEAIISVSARGVILEANQKMYQTFGSSPEEIIGKNFLDLPYLPRKSIDKVLKMFKQRHLGQDVPPYELEIKTKSGEVRMTRILGTTIRDHRGKPQQELVMIQDITEQKLAEQALVKSEEKYRKMFDLSPEPILIVGPDGKLIEASQNYHQLFGTTTEDIIGKKFMELPYLPKDSLDKITDMFKKRISGKKVPPYEVEILTKNGKTKTVRILAETFRDNTGGFQQELVILHDITEQKKNTEALLRAKQEWEKTFDTVPELIAITDKNHVIRRINMAMANRLGKHPRELVGRKCHRVVHGKNSLPVFCPHKSHSESNGEKSVEFHEEKLGGDFMVTITPWLNEKGESIGFVHTAVDISERKWVEDLIKNQRDLAQALSVTTTLYQALSLCLDSAIRVSGMDSGGVYLVNPKSGDIELIHSVGLSEMFKKATSYYPADSQRAKLVMKGKPLYQEYKKFYPKTKGPVHRDEGLMTLAMVPVLHEGKVVGCLNIASHTVRQFTGHAKTALETIAAQIGDVIIRIRAEDQLRLAMEQLQSLTSHLQNVREQERIQVARELHDELSSMLTILKMWVVRISDGLAPFTENREMAKLKEKTDAVEELINKSVTIVRRMITQLRPSILDDLGLVPAIEWYVEDFQDNSGIECTLRSSIEQIDLEPVRATAVFRILQELLTNVARHANATGVSVRLEKTPAGFTMEVNDNGRGIRQSELDKTESFGIIGMRERANLFNWPFTIKGSSGEGTRVILEVPLNGEKQ